MYLSFFGLDKQPFNITPDPALLYSSPSHKEALAALTYGITERKGCVALIGEVGVGKTTIIRCVLERLTTENLKIIHLFNANISFTNLLRTAFQSLGQVPRSDELFGMVRQFHQTLSDLHTAGINVVLVIDEAQNMPVEALHHLHLLSNLEAGTEKLIQIVFSGQPEFEDKLNSVALRQLKQRIAIKVRIVPLTRKDSLEYIAFRLAMAGHGGSTLFTAGAMRRIIGEAAGIPRIINTLCDNCLITAFGKQQRRVTASIAREIIADFGGPRRQKIAWSIPALASLVVVASALWLYGRSAPSPAQAPITPVHKPAAAVVDVKVPMPKREQSGDVQPARELKAVYHRTQPVAAVAKGGKRPHHKKVGKPIPNQGSIPMHKVVKKGDTLQKLVLETYGSVNGRLLDLVRHNNPRVTTMDSLQGGERIYFPSRDN